MELEAEFSLMKIKINRLLLSDTEVGDNCQKAQKEAIEDVAHCGDSLAHQQYGVI